MTLGDDLDEVGFEADDWSFEGCRRRMRKASAVVMTAENNYDLAAKRAADAEAVYRRQLAEKVRGYREAGKAVEESMTLARADVATLSRERDYARDMVKLAAEKLDDARDGRRSVWRLVEWARDRDLALLRPGQQLAMNDERAPANQWP
jgi:hypothetical protein